MVKVPKSFRKEKRNAKIPFPETLREFLANSRTAYNLDFSMFVIFHAILNIR